MVVVDLFGGWVITESEAKDKGYKILYGPASIAQCYFWRLTRLKL